MYKKKNSVLKLISIHTVNVSMCLVGSSFHIHSSSASCLNDVRKGMDGVKSSQKWVKKSRIDKTIKKRENMVKKKEIEKKYLKI